MYSKGLSLNSLSPTVQGYSVLRPINPGKYNALKCVELSSSWLHHERCQGVPLVLIYQLDCRTLTLSSFHTWRNSISWLMGHSYTFSVLKQGKISHSTCQLLVTKRYGVSFSVFLSLIYLLLQTYALNHMIIISGYKMSNNPPYNASYNASFFSITLFSDNNLEGNFPEL